MKSDLPQPPSHQPARVSSSRPASRRFKTYLILGLFCFSVVVLAAFLPWTKSGQQIIRDSLERSLNSIRAAGDPLTVEEMAERFPDPPADRDANLLLKAAFSLVSAPDEATNIPFFGESKISGALPLDRSIMEVSRELLDRNESAFDAVPWETIRGSWFGCSFARGLTNLSLPSKMPMLKLVKLLCLKAVLDAEARKPDQSIQSLQRALLLGSTLKDDVPIHLFFRAACEQHVCEAVERVLNQTTVADEALAQLGESLTLTKAGSVTRKTVVFDRLDGLLMADTLKSQSVELTKGAVSPLSRLVRTFQAHALYRDRDLLDLLQYDERFLAALELPMGRAIPEILAMEKHNHETLQHRPVSFLNSWRRERSSFVTLMGTNPSLTLLGELPVVAKIRETLIAIAIQRWRHLHDGQAPSSLTELAPALTPNVLEDPFTGQPMAYKRFHDGYYLECVWPDENTRRLLPSHYVDRHYDVTFRLGSVEPDH